MSNQYVPFFNQVHTLFDQNLKYFIYFSTKSPTKIKDNCHHNRSFPTLPSVQTQSCLTLCDPMDHSLLGSSVHGILQARILEWVAMPFSRGSSQPKDWTWAPVLQEDSLPFELPRKFPTLGILKKEIYPF